MGHGRAALKSDIQLPAHKLPKSEQSHGGFEGSPRRPVMTQLRPMRANKIFQDVFPAGGPTHICQTTSFRAVRCRFQELRVSKTIKTSPTMHDGHLALSGKPGNMPCPTQVQTTQLDRSWKDTQAVSDATDDTVQTREEVMVTFLRCFGAPTHCPQAAKFHDTNVSKQPLARSPATRIEQKRSHQRVISRSLLTKGPFYCRTWLSHPTMKPKSSPPDD